MQGVTSAAQTKIDPGDFFARARSGQENPIDAGLNAGLGTCERPLQALAAQRGDASDNDKRGILSSRHGGVELAEELGHRD